MQTTLKKCDVLVMVLMLCAALLLFLLPLLQGNGKQTMLVVSHSDGSEQLYALDSDAALTLHGNGHTLTVVIENGTVRVSQSTCPDGLCRAGHISRDGETLVCLPAGIVLTVQSGEGGEVDAVVG